MGTSEIINTEKRDLDLVFEFFNRSILYQEQRGYPSWRNYDKAAIIRDMEHKNQYKVTRDSKIAIVFSLCYADKIIWRHMDSGESVYLHRIVVNPDFKGQKLFGSIVDWTSQHAKSFGYKNIRMDTWAANANIIRYYQTFGFEKVENYLTPTTPELPVHNRNLALTLLQLNLNK